MSELTPDSTPDAQSPAPPNASQPKLTPESVTEALKDVIDPELGINVVDLGLLYGVTVADDGFVDIDMTLTTPACPLTDFLEDQVDVVLHDMGAKHKLHWVWYPLWTPEKITDDGREQLRMIGFNF